MDAPRRRKILGIEGRRRAARTPTVSGGRVYTFGATGIVNALDAATAPSCGRATARRTPTSSIPDWGFSGSPLVVDDLVIVAVSGKLVAYDRAHRHTALDRSMGRRQL